MIAAFDIHDVNKAASAFNNEKLLWLNQQHMVRAAPSAIVPHLRYQLERLGLKCDDDAMLEGLIVAQRERAKTLKEMAQNSRFFFTDTIEMDPKAAAKHLGADAAEGLREVQKRLGALAEWTAPAIHDALNGLATEKGVGLGKIVQPVRVAISGGTVSPPIDATLALLGRERTLAPHNRRVGKKPSIAGRLRALQSSRAAGRSFRSRPALEGLLAQRASAPQSHQPVPAPAQSTRLHHKRETPRFPSGE